MIHAICGNQADWHLPSLFDFKRGRKADQRRTMIGRRILRKVAPQSAHRHFPLLIDNFDI